MKEDKRRDGNGLMKEVTVERKGLEGVAMTFHYPTGTVEHFIPNEIAIDIIKAIGIAY